MQIKGEVLTTQKTALFYVSAELSRRGCNVSILDDSLIVILNKEKEKIVKVSGQKFKKKWIVDLEKDYKADFYIFVFIPKDLYTPPEFFILSEKEIKKEIKNRKLKSPDEFLKEGLYTLPFSTINKYADKWFSLEEY